MPRERYFIRNPKVDKNVLSKQRYNAVFDDIEHYYSGRNIDDLTEDEVLSYLASKTEGASRHNFRIVVLRRYYQAQLKRELHEYLFHIPLQKTDKRVCNIRQCDVDYMIAACETIRDAAMIELMADVGLRAGEVSTLQVQDLDFIQQGIRIHVRKGKTGPRVIRGLSSTALMGQWMERHPCKENPESPLFCTTKGNPLSPTGINMQFQWIEQRAMKLHPDMRHIFPHALRHFAATRCSRNGMTDVQLMNHFGWKSLQMVATYTDIHGEETEQAFLRANGGHVEKEAEIEVITKCPRCRIPNDHGATFCAKCGSPMNITVLENVEKKIDEGDTLIEKLLSNPKLLQKLKGALLQPGG